jgi:hypothetical protein
MKELDDPRKNFITRMHSSFLGTEFKADNDENPIPVLLVPQSAGSRLS